MSRTHPNTRLTVGSLSPNSTESAHAGARIARSSVCTTCGAFPDCGTDSIAGHFLVSFPNACSASRSDAGIASACHGMMYPNRKPYV